MSAASTLTPTAEIVEDDLLLIGSSFFLVKEVREPRHPAFPGVSFYGFYWHEKRGGGNWSPELRYVPAETWKKWRVDNGAKGIFPTLPL